MWKNSICVDPDCTSAQRCCHMGPQGQLCFFDHEKALCAILGIRWEPGLAFSDLCDRVRQLVVSADQHDLTAALAERMKPSLRELAPTSQLASLREEAKDPE